MRHAYIIALMGLCSCTPFQRPVVVLGAPEDLNKVSEVTADGFLRLDDGRRVRLFGVVIPADESQRAEFVRRLRSLGTSVHGVEAIEIIPGDPAAVDLIAWRAGFGFACDFTWNPLGGSARRIHSYPEFASAALLQAKGAALDEADLRHPAAHAEVVERLRTEYKRRR